MTVPKDVRGLTAADYAAAKHELLAAPVSARPKPTTAADRPDWQCLDVRAEPAATYQRHKAEFLGRWS